jgi:hypothetical protein
MKQVFLFLRLDETGILVSSSLTMGSKGYPGTYLSYNITPCHKPKELQQQFHRDESLTTQV